MSMFISALFMDGLVSINLLIPKEVFLWMHLSTIKSLHFGQKALTHGRNILRKDPELSIGCSNFINCYHVGGCTHIRNIGIGFPAIHDFMCGFYHSFLETTMHQVNFTWAMLYITSLF